MLHVQSFFIDYTSNFCYSFLDIKPVQEQEIFFAWIFFAWLGFKGWGGARDFIRLDVGRG